jgi:hypothetical protein
MIIIYKLIGANNVNYGVSSTEVSFEEEKENIINLYLTNKISISDKYTYLNITKLCVENDINKFALCEIIRYDYVPKDKLIIMLRAYQKRNNKILHKKETVISYENVKGKKLNFRTNWEKFKRPTIIANENNEVLQKVSRKLSIDIEEVCDVVKYLSMYINESLKVREPVRIPVIGSFRTKKNIFRKENGSLLLYKIMKEMKDDENDDNNDNNYKC